jgi:uncharacterized membrane protein
VVTLPLRGPVQHRRRALVKTLGYRGLMLLVTTVVALVVVGDAGAALRVGLAANLVKTGTYYAYERVWDHVAWGVVSE